MFWLRADILPLDMMAELQKPIRNNELVNTNAGTHYAIAQDTDDADNIDFIVTKKLPSQLATFPAQKTVALKIRFHMRLMRG